MYYEFYDDTDPASPQSRIVKYDIEDTYSESPKLNVVARINNASLLHSAAVMTINGLLVDEQTGDDIEQLATLYSDTGTKTTPKLYRAGGRVEAAFALAEFPTLPSAQTNEVAASDFYVAASDAPAKINTFLADYSENNPDCSDGEYVTLELDRFDGDKQFGVFQSGCEKIGLAVFKQNGDSYKIVTTLLEGITCERRDELGISEKVAECFKPGEGI